MSTPRKHSMEFDEFVKRQQPTPNEMAQVDWVEERDQWLSYLDLLYRSVERFLKPYIDDHTIDLSYKDVVLNEENIGEYAAKQMTLQIGRQRVAFTPIGTLLIGTKGRVDVEGAAGKARLILADRQSQRPQIKVTIQRGNDASLIKAEPRIDIDWTWKIATMPPHVSYVELTQESLFDLVMEVANG